MTYTVRDLVQRFNVTEQTVLCWINSGELPAINVGKAPGKKKPRWRITEKALAEWELLRSTAPPLPRKRRKKKDPSVIEFY